MVSICVRMHGDRWASWGILLAAVRRNHPVAANVHLPDGHMAARCVITAGTNVTGIEAGTEGIHVHMRSPLKLSALLALVLLAMSLVGGTGVGAQDDLEDDFQPSDLDGIQYGVARTWSMDYEAMFAMTTPGAEDDFAMPSGVLFMGGLVLEFDNEDNAKSGYDRITEEFTAEALFGDDGATYEEWDVESGNQSMSYFSIEETEGVESEIVLSLVQDDNFVYIVSAAGSDIDMKDTTKGLMGTMIDNDGSGEGEFNEDGTSTGGLWDKFPAADDEAVAGLIATDEILYPESAEE